MTFLCAVCGDVTARRRVNRDWLCPYCYNWFFAHYPAGSLVRARYETFCERARRSWWEAFLGKRDLVIGEEEA